MSQPIVTVWTWHSGGLGGISPGTDRHFVDAVARHGHAITTVGSKDWNHHVAGIGVGHDDAAFSEGGVSQAVYGENGEAFGGRWWEDTARSFSTGRKYYGCADMRP